MDLGGFSDLPGALGFAPPTSPAIDSSGLLRLFGKLPPFPADFAMDRGRSWYFEGIRITQLSWSVGWGPWTEALLLVPEGAAGPLPGALFLHSHDDLKEFGKEKFASGAVELPPRLQWVRKEHYGGRTPANELARRGFAILAYNCFMWGSRRFPEGSIPGRLREILEADDYERPFGRRRPRQLPPRDIAGSGRHRVRRGHGHLRLEARQPCRPAFVDSLSARHGRRLRPSRAGVQPADSFDAPPLIDFPNTAKRMVPRSPNPAATRKFAEGDLFHSQALDRAARETITSRMR